MNCHFRVQVLVFALFVLAAAAPAFCQQEKGDSEIGLSGSVSIPNSDPGTTSGSVFVSYAYYFRKNDSVGAYTLATFAKNSFTIGPLVEYRHLFSTKNPKVYPFLGAAGGFAFDHQGGDFSSNSWGGTAAGEGGIKFFVSQRTALDVTYYFIYTTGQSGFANSTSNLIAFGFTHILGGPKK